MSRDDMYFRDSSGPYAPSPEEKAIKDAHQHLRSDLWELTNSKDLPDTHSIDEEYRLLDLTVGDLRAISKILTKHGY